MIRPRYIICCQRRVVDRETNLISHIDVVDELTFTIPPAGKEKGGRRGFVFALCFSTVWMRENDEEKTAEYEAEFRIFLPGEDEPRVFQPANFKFGDHRFYRLDFNFHSIPESPDRIPLRAGILRFENRIRRVGSEEWLSQDFLIPLNVQRLEAPPEDEQDEASGREAGEQE